MPTPLLRDARRISQSSLRFERVRRDGMGVSDFAGEVHPRDTLKCSSFVVRLDGGLFEVNAASRHHQLLRVYDRRAPTLPRGDIFQHKGVATPPPSRQVSRVQAFALHHEKAGLICGFLSPPRIYRTA